ncbi:hypothetical protein [Vibrio sp. ABG19]|uniref:hypothetical protein n=1 Tax=Vibrio sp. ABG19 TaxID=2817385 RepID=UPI00249EADA3|nr:hypothetical protein [Vibrio sp. ABG19]WGY45223.1 hypothetical protein J0X00_05885 [Vibrio sp. ABG19]
MAGDPGGGERKETAAEKAASQIAVKQWNIYNKELKPFENLFMQRVDNINSDSNMADVKQSTDLSYNREYGKAREATAENLAQAGIDPSSAKFQSTLSDLATDQAIAQGDTVNRAQSAEQDKYVTGKQDIVAIGQGQKAEGLAGINDTANLASQRATNDAYSDFNRSAATAQTVGTLAGIGTSMYLNRDTVTPDTGFVSDQSRSLSLADNRVYNPQSATHLGGR